MSNVSGKNGCLLGEYSYLV